MNSRLTALFLLLAVVVYRVGTGFASPDLAAQLTGFAPFAAMVLGAAVLVPQAKWAWLPAVAFLASDLILNLWVYQTPAFHPYIFMAVAFYGLLFLVARRLSGRPGLALPFLGATAGAVVAFHLISNSVSWAVNPLYAKSVAGFIQAHTTGLPGFAPTWLFLVKSLAGNLAFAGLFLAAMAPVRAASSATLPARA